ncbi:MAG: hypothetical protein PWP24_1125 [Clostridiales bacterium]|nr:hypothetical protein [Clostridiales bacterium]
MRHMDEVMEEYNIEGFKSDNTDEILLTKEQKIRILEETRRKVAFEKKDSKEEKIDIVAPKRRGRIRIIGLVAMVAIFIMMSGMVMASMNGSSIFEHLLNGQNKKSRDTIEQMSTIIGQEKRVGEYSVTLTECLSDDNEVYMLFVVKAPKNVSLSRNQYLFGREEIFVEGGGAMGYYPMMVQDEDPNDNQITIMYSMENHNGITGKTISIRLHDLVFYNEEGNAQTVAKGLWEFSFQLKKNLKTKTYLMFKKLRIDDKNYYITSVKLSPISLNLTITQSPTNIFRSGYLDTSKLMGEFEILLKNGEKISCDSSGAGTKAFGYGVHFQFSRIVDLDQIEEIMYQGIKLR